MKSSVQEPGKTIAASKIGTILRGSLAERLERRPARLFVRVALHAQDLQKSKRMYCEREKAVDRPI
jgi:hypothetical protein